MWVIFVAIEWDKIHIVENKNKQNTLVKKYNIFYIRK